ncbi:MAG: hypothetical protein M1835_006792 [Candelina submexicana]|nr:MAG: hypothetical protein M1835_006792 [Candelina submexicana]
MSSNRSSSGIRNLRAMFENGNGTTSPEPRGRSPAAEGQGELSRPISKVRTSFVAVEKSGQMGPQLGDSDARSIAKNADNSTDNSATNGATSTDTSSGGDAGHHNGNHTLKPNGELAAEGARENMAEGEPRAVSSTATAQKASTDDEKSRQTGTTTVAPTTTQGPDQPAPSEATKEDSLKQDKPTDISPNDGSADVAKSPHKDKNPSSPSKLDNTKPASGRARTNRPSLNMEASRKSPPKPSATMRSAKSPKTPTTPGITKATTPSSTSKGVVTSKPSPLPKPLSKPSVSSPRQSAISPNTQNGGNAANKSSRASIAAKPPSRTSPANKPRPKSPTRPTRIPAAATAPTASSAAKTGASQSSAAQSSARASLTGIRRQQSAANRTSAASNLRKESSRPSITPQNGPVHLKSRVSSAGSKPSAEGFLARMMRPTASSASKTHEKTEVKSPPKRTSTLKSKRRSGGDIGETEKAKQVNGHGTPHESLIEPDKSINTAEADASKETTGVASTAVNHGTEEASVQG